MPKYSIVPDFRTRLLKVSDNCYLLAVVRFPSDKFGSISRGLTTVKTMLKTVRNLIRLSSAPRKNQLMTQSFRLTR